MTDVKPASILLIDMNSYFASVEQACNPGLRGKPIGICGEGRTVVVTASYEARAYGVKTGMTVYEAKRLCPGFIPVIGNLEKYVSTSLRIHKIMLGYTDMVEVFSIDECFMDVADVAARHGGAAAVAQGIKDGIKRELGITCSAGVAPNKTIAKLAAKMKKPDGLTVIERSEIPEKFHPVPVEKLQGIGIGARTAEKLRLMGITNVKELGAADTGRLKDRFGKFGIWMKSVGLGLEDSRVRSYYEEEPLKSVGHSLTLPRDTADTEVLKSYLRMLCEKTGSRMRRYGLEGRTVAFTLRYEDFRTETVRRTWNSYFNAGIDIYDRACEILGEFLPLEKYVRLLGVSVSNVIKTGQEYLLEEDRKQSALYGAIDEINSEWGEFTVKPASLLKAEKFAKMEKRCGMFGKDWVRKDS